MKPLSISPAEPPTRPQTGTVVHASALPATETMTKADRLSVRPPRQLTVVVSQLPAVILAAGPDVTRRFVEFFTANIRNRNTGTAYAWAVRDFSPGATNGG